MRKLSQAETACLLAILVLLWIGCEKEQAESQKIGHVIPVSPYVKQLDAALERDVQIRGSIADTVEVIGEHSELQPGY